MSKTARKTTIEAPVTAGCKIADSVGALLKKARLDLGCSRSEAAARMKVPERYVSAFEENDFGRLPDDVYTRIYLKVYCRFLGLDTATTMKLYRQERTRSLAAKAEPAEKRHPAVHIPATQMIATPNLIRTALLVATVAGLAVYLWWAVGNIIRPPQITLWSPRDGLVTPDHSVTIEGQTEKEVSLQINGKTVAPDTQGNFRDSLDLQAGLNVITVIGAKKHSREMILTRRILVQPGEKTTAAADLGAQADN